MADKFPTTWLKNWSAPSYDPNTGRSASAFGDGGSSTMDGERINPLLATRGGLHCRPEWRSRLSP